MNRQTLLLLLLAPASLAAQVPGLSSRALGLAGAYTVTARGFEAPSWNPAVLAAPGRPSFSLGLPSAEFEFGSSAYGLGDLRRYSGKHLTDQDKTDLLAKVDTTGLDVRMLAGGSPFGISIGPFALSVTAAGNMDARLGKDAVELALFGNAHNPARLYTAAGSRTNAWGAGTFAASYAMPFRLPLGRLAIGVTGKVIYGLGLARGEETASQFQVSPAFAAHGAGHGIYTNYPNGTSDGAPGHGFGFDVGGVLTLPGGLTVGATLVNVVGSMSWNENRFQYERVDYQVTQSSSGQVTDVEVHTTLKGSAINGDPVAVALRDSMLAHANFSKLVRGGAMMHIGGLMLAAEGSLRLSEGLDRQPKQSLAAGAEYVLLGILPLRAGIGSDFSSGLTLSAGTGLYVGPLKLDVGVANISGSDHPGVRVGAGLSLIFGNMH